MTITRTSEQFNNGKSLREQANVGCNKCPCCGEEKRDLEYLKKGILNRGISRGLYYNKEVRTGFFSSELKQVDCYSCLTCGAKWESDPY